VANELGQSEGWRMVVENKSGAIGTIAATEVLKQPADGHTIFGIALPTTAAPALLPNISFRLDVDFAPVIKLITSHHVLVVNPSVPAKSMAELVALLKEHPDKFTFSSGGFGTPAHLTGELFKLHTGVRAAHVSYRVLPQAIADLLNGTNHYQFITALPVLDLIAAGKLRALAVTAPTRMPLLKDVPNVVEEGFPQLVIEEWVGLVVKSGTPNTIIARLNEATNNALAKPSVREALQKIASEPAGGSPGEIDFYPLDAGADELIDQFAIAGSAEHCAERLREIVDLGISRVYIGTRAVGVDLNERNSDRVGREVLPLLRT
jgi:tripartite-type tricarboxylate transporter receptor subunit TctC